MSTISIHDGGLPCFGRDHPVMRVAVCIAIGELFGKSHNGESSRVEEEISKV